MPLNIDLRFRWGPKKPPEDEKKKDDSSSSSSSSGSSTSCSSDSTTCTSTTTSMSSVTGTTETMTAATQEDVKTCDETLDAKMRRKLEKKKKKKAVPPPTPEEEPDVPEVLPQDVLRRLIVMRHAERLDRVFPTWQRLAFVGREYRPYDVNQPLRVPKRFGGADAFTDDPPISLLGRQTAELTAQGIRNAQVVIKAVFCSPALRCVETASEVIRHLGAKGAPSRLKIRVEPGLFDWGGFYVGGAPVWMTNDELVDAGFPIDTKYQPLVTRSTALHTRNEMKHEFYRRCQDVVQRLLVITSGTVLVVGHATTMDAVGRSILSLKSNVPSFHQMDTLGERHYPYASTLFLEQCRDSGRWRLPAVQLPTLTSVGGDTRASLKFLQR